MFGDLMLDLYLSGKVDRVSPEAPVPILKVDGERMVPGGAANVAANVVGLGAKALVSGLVGSDVYGQELMTRLRELGADTTGIHVSESRPTTVKTRLIAQHHQLGRFDRELAAPLGSGEADGLWTALGTLVDRCDAVLVSDYSKGVVGEEIVTRLITKARSLHKPVFVDPKGLDFSKYRNADLLTPNEREALDAAEFLGCKKRDVISSGHFLVENLELPSLLVTLGEKGMLLFGPGTAPVAIDAEERNVFDVTGAGDTVISTIAVAVASGVPMPEAARIANSAAGIVVERLGTTPVDISALSSEFSG